MAGSLRVSYVALEGTLFIDVDSARNLELVKNNITHRTYNTLYGEHHDGGSTDQVGVLNHCKTPMGSRMLLMTILQPPNSAFQSRTS
jgi:DNA mismatch repair protein MSH4